MATAAGNQEVSLEEEAAELGLNRELPGLGHMHRAYGGPRDPPGRRVRWSQGKGWEWRLEGGGRRGWQFQAGPFGRPSKPYAWWMWSWDPQGGEFCFINSSTGSSEHIVDIQ